MMVVQQLTFFKTASLGIIPYRGIAATKHREVATDEPGVPSHALSPENLRAPRRFLAIVVQLQTPVLRRAMLPQLEGLEFVEARREPQSLGLPMHGRDCEGVR
jgi:hypothetical protein